MADTTTKNSGSTSSPVANNIKAPVTSIYTDLIPEKNRGSLQSAPTQKYGIFSDLVPNKTTGKVKETTRDLGIYSDLVPKKEEKKQTKDTGPSLTSRFSEFLAGAAADPEYTTGSKWEILKNLPNEIVRTILPGAAALNDNPELASTITNKDIAKEVPMAVAKTTFDMFVAPLASYGLTMYGATSKVLSPVLGKAPGTDETGGVNIDTPLGKITNVQGRIASEPAPKNNLDYASSFVKHTGTEIMNALYAASMVSGLVNPRISPITKSGEVKLPKNFQTEPAPKTFGYQEPKVFKGQVSPEAFNKVVLENNIPVRPSYSSKNPIFFQLKTVNGSTAKGQFFQIKPSYLDKFKNVFKGDPTKVPTTEMVPIADVSHSLTVSKPTPNTPVIPPIPKTPDIVTEEVSLPTGEIAVPETAQDLILKPSEVSTEGAKLLVDKTDIKQIVKSVPEFKENPVLTVDENKNLTFATADQSFKIKPEAMGLTAEKLTSGDQITVDVPSLKVKGAPKQMRVYKGDEVFASVGEFTDGTPLSLGARESVKPIELPEMVHLATELMGTAPKIRTQVSRAFGGQARGTFKAQGEGEIKLRADLFDPKVTSPDQVAKVLAHEIGHLVDYLPEGTMARGNLLGRLGTLNEFRKDFLADAGVSRSNEAIKKELYEFSKYWRPFDEATATPGFMKYRSSSKELYADFISGLFNDPVRLQNSAPEAYNAFFKMLDQKPKVRDAYFELQAALTGDRNSIIERRRFGIQKMFKEGDILSAEYQKKLQIEKNSSKWSIQFLKYMFVDNNIGMIERVRKLEEKGIVLNMDQDPRYMFEERNYLSGLIKSEVEKFVSPIVNNLKLNNIPWDTFGEALFYERIILGDRSVQANPQGITTDVAIELYNDLRNKLGPQKTQVLNHEINNFRTWLKSVATKAHTEGLYTDDLFKQMQENPAYVTFRVLEHIEENMTSAVYKSIGTLKDITNPANASILKAIATIKAMERNKTTKASVDVLTEYYPNDILPADKQFNGRVMTFKEPKKKGFNLITFKRNGKTEGYYVDDYIASSINNSTIGEIKVITTVMSPINFLNRNLFKPVFIGYNPGFQMFNFIRDFKRYWKNMPDTTLVVTMKDYIKAMPIAQARSFGLSENPSERMLKAKDDLQTLEGNKVFSITYTDYNIGATSEDKEIDMILEKSGLIDGKESRFANMSPVMDGIIKILDLLQKTGNYIETLPKAAAAIKMSKGDMNNLTDEQRSFIRKYVGSPDFLAKGYLSPVSNDIFLFSNAITQGMRSDLKIATDPKTRSGYWWKTAQMTLIPKILIFMAGLGLFGPTIKKLYDGVSEYDKTNYTIVPLGSDENGKTIYLRIPEDETSRFIGGLFWKGMRFFDPSQKQPVGQQLGDIFSFLGGQVPGLTPVLTGPGTIVDYLQGKNPYDSFRGRNVISDNVFKAHNWETDKAFIGYLFNQIGGSVIYNFQAQGSTPAQTSGAEEFVKLPIVSNTIGRFLRVSDYGVTEQLNQVKENVQTDRARVLLENNKLVNKYIDQAIKVDGFSDRRKLELALVKERFNGEPKTEADVTEARNIITKFRVGLTKGISGPEVDSLATASTNAEKTAILKNIQTRMTPGEFKKLREVAVKERLVSTEVFEKLKKDEK